jgi:hypothetical protein
VTETTTRPVPTYQPTPSVDKVRRGEFRALMEIVADAARELAEFVYVAWQAEDDGERAAALRDGRRCLQTADTYLGVLEGLGGSAEQ